MFKIFFSSFSTPNVSLIGDHLWDCPKGDLNIGILLYFTRNKDSLNWTTNFVNCKCVTIFFLSFFLSFFFSFFFSSVEIQVNARDH